MMCWNACNEPKVLMHQVHGKVLQAKTWNHFFVPKLYGCVSSVCKVRACLRASNAEHTGGVHGEAAWEAEERVWGTLAPRLDRRGILSLRERKKHMVKILCGEEKSLTTEVVHKWRITRLLYLFACRVYVLPLYYLGRNIFSNPQRWNPKKN